MKSGVIVMWIVCLSVAFGNIMQHRIYKFSSEDVYCSGSVLRETTASSDSLCALKCNSDALCVAYSRRGSQCVLHDGFCSLSDLLPEAGAHYAGVQWACFGSSCYYMPTLLKRLGTAKARPYCEKLGAHLLMIETAEENELVKKLLTGFVHSWINVEKKGLQWKHNGEQLSYTNWSGPTAYACAAIKSNGRWHSHFCTNPYPFLCEK